MRENSDSFEKSKSQRGAYVKIFLFRLEVTIKSTAMTMTTLTRPGDGRAVSVGHDLSESEGTARYMHRPAWSSLRKLAGIAMIVW